MSSSRSRCVLGAVFVLAGVGHFVMPGAYLRILPPGYPAPLALVWLSGAAELLGGAGVLSPWPRVRAWAGWGLVALLLAVYPANVHMAVETGAWWAWARLPLQGVLVAWALLASGAVRPGGRQAPGVNVPGQASRARSSVVGA